MPSIHRHDDTRTCSATTTVVGQSTVTAGGKLVSVTGDPETHGAGEFFDPPGRTVSISGKHIIIVGDEASSDGAFHPTGATNSASGLDTITIS